MRFTITDHTTQLAATFSNRIEAERQMFYLIGLGHDVTWEVATVN